MKLEIDDKDWAQIGMIVATVFASRRMNGDDRVRYIAKLKDMKLTPDEMKWALTGMGY